MDQESKDTTLPAKTAEGDTTPATQTPSRIRELWQEAKIFAESGMVPDSYQKRPADCYVAVQLAKQMGINPFVFMQQSYPVRGKIGIQGKLVLALLRTRSPFAADFDVTEPKGEGDARFVTASGTDARTGEHKSYTLTLKKARECGWFDKAESWWRKLPDQMLIYRCASLFCDAYCSEIRLGCVTVEEMQDMGDGVAVIGRGQSKLSAKLVSSGSGNASRS